MNIKATRVWVTGVHNSNDQYLASISMNIQAGNFVFQINNMRLVKLPDGRVILAMPAKKTKSGTEREVFHCLNEASRNFMEQTALWHYEQVKAQSHKGRYVDR